MALLAKRQHGIASRDQLRGLGVSDRSISRAVDAGHLHPLFRGVFGVGHAPSSEPSRMLAAVLACGEGTVVSHLTAAHLLGLRDQSPASIEVIAPGGSGRGIDGVRRHFVPVPMGQEAGHCQAVPCTSPSRTLVDLAGMLGRRALGQSMERAAVLDLLDVSAIERALARGRRRGAPLLRRMLQEWHPTHAASGTPESRSGNPDLRSELEARLLTLINAAGLPSPRCNRPVEVGQKRFVVDFLWPEQRLVVEADGRRFHGNPLAFERDRLRDRVLQLDGYRVIRLTFRQIEGEPGTVIAAIRRMLDDLG